MQRLKLFCSPAPGSILTAASSRKMDVVLFKQRQANSKDDAVTRTATRCQYPQHGSLRPWSLAPSHPLPSWVWMCRNQNRPALTPSALLPRRGCGQLRRGETRSTKTIISYFHPLLYLTPDATSPIRTRTLSKRHLLRPAKTMGAILLIQLAKAMFQSFGAGVGASRTC